MKNQEILNTIVVPKGENRKSAEGWLIDQGMPLPRMRRRCLHANQG